jgi:NAD-dependent DNA ligase
MSKQYKCPLCGNKLNSEIDESTGKCENSNCPVETTKIRKRIIKPETFENKKNE